MSGNVPFPLPQDRRHTQPVVDMFRYVPPVEQTPSAEAEKQEKKDNSKSDAASVASTSTFASTKALLKNKFGGSRSSQKEADKKRAAEQAKILKSTPATMASTKEEPRLRRHGSAHPSGEKGGRESSSSTASRDTTNRIDII